MAASFGGTRLRTVRVDASMSKQVHICSPEDTIETAEQIMATHKAHRLAVADAGGRLRGILSLSDIARRYRVKQRGKGIAATDIAATRAANAASTDHPEGSR